MSRDPRIAAFLSGGEQTGVAASPRDPRIAAFLSSGGAAQQTITPADDAPPEAAPVEMPAQRVAPPSPADALRQQVYERVQANRLSMRQREYAQIYGSEEAGLENLGMVELLEQEYPELTDEISKRVKQGVPANTIKADIYARVAKNRRATELMAQYPQFAKNIDAMFRQNLTVDDVATRVKAMADAQARLDNQKAIAESDKRQREAEAAAVKLAQEKAKAATDPKERLRYLDAATNIKMKRSTEGPAQVGPVAAGVSAAATRIMPAAVGVLGAMAGGSVPGPVGAKAVGGLLGMFGASAIANEAQSSIIRGLVGEEGFADLQAQEAYNREQYPVATFAGEVAPSLAAGRPSLPGVGQAAAFARRLARAGRGAGAILANPANREATETLVNALLGAGTPAAIAAYQKISGGDVDWLRVLAESALGTVFNKSWVRSRQPTAYDESIPARQQLARQRLEAETAASETAAVEAEMADRAVRREAGATAEVITTGPERLALPAATPRFIAGESGVAARGVEPYSPPAEPVPTTTAETVAPPPVRPAVEPPAPARVPVAEREASTPPPEVSPPATGPAAIEPAPVQTPAEIRADLESQIADLPYKQARAIVSKAAKEAGVPVKGTNDEIVDAIAAKRAEPVAAEKTDAPSASEQRQDFDVERFGAVPLPMAAKNWQTAARLHELRDAVRSGGVAERIAFPEYKVLSRAERDELMRYGWTFDVDRMGEPLIGLSDARKIEYKRWKMAQKRATPPPAEASAKAVEPAPAKTPAPAPPAPSEKVATVSDKAAERASFFESLPLKDMALASGMSPDRYARVESFISGPDDNAQVVRPLKSKARLDVNGKTVLTEADVGGYGLKYAEHLIGRRGSAIRSITDRSNVSAAAVDKYGIKLPPGYVREGDRYVFIGEAAKPTPKYDPEAIAVEFASDPKNLRKRLMWHLEWAGVGSRDMWKLDADNRRMISPDGKKAVVWQTRPDPESPPSYNNQQTTQGDAKIVSLQPPAKPAMDIAAESAAKAKPLPGATRKSGAIGFTKQKAAVAVQPSSDPDVVKVQHGLEKQERDMSRQLLVRTKKAMDAVAEAAWDRQNLAKKTLIADQLREAESRMITRAGWTARARQRYDESLNRIDRIITHGNEQAFSHYVEMRRLKEVADLMETRGKPYSLPYGWKKADVNKWLAAFEAQHTADGTIASWRNAADEYFKVGSDMLDEMHTAGLLSDAAYNKLKAEHKSYSPQQMIEYLDPDGVVAGGTGTGIRELKAGSESGRISDYRYLMGRTIAIAQNRIMANRANKALVDGVYQNGAAATGARIPAYPDEPVPRGMAAIHAYDAGQKKTIFVPEEWAKSWNDMGWRMDHTAAEWFRWLSGAKVVKALATGYNPEFALSNLPRDSAFALFTTDEFGTFMPAAAKALASEQKAVFEDAVKMGPLWREFVEEGGAIDGLAREGRIDKDPWDKVTPQGRVAEDVHKFLSAMGEASERITRLAVYSKAKKNGKPKWEAARIARDMMDFQQGGYAAKTFDTFIPYLNAGIIGTRGLVRAFQRSPIKTSLKAAQVMALASAMTYTWKNYFPDVWDSISDQEKATKWIIPLPKMFSRKDENGRTRHRYIAIPKDQGQALFATLAMSLTAAANGEKFNGKAMWQSIQNVFPDIDATSPAYAAYAAYFDNRDTYTKDKVYQGRPSLPSAELSESEAMNKAAAELSRITDGVVDISPERAKVAASKLILPHNPLVFLTGATIDAALSGDVKPLFADWSGAKFPFARRFIRETQPVDVAPQVEEKAERLGVDIKGDVGKAARVKVEQAERELGAMRNKQDAELERILRDVRDGKQPESAVWQFLNSQDGGKDERTRLGLRAATMREKMGMKPVKYNRGRSGIPSVFKP